MNNAQQVRSTDDTSRITRDPKIRSELKEHGLRSARSGITLIAIHTLSLFYNKMSR